MKLFMISCITGTGGLKMKHDLEAIKVTEVFNQYNYLIPIYQRNFAWTETEIEQLLEDIASADGNYFLGNLIVNYRMHERVYEVIDGQQRLTTLFLLLNYLGDEIQYNALRFEAREKSNHTLREISIKGLAGVNLEGLTSEIIEGYETIKNYFERKKNNREIFINQLNDVSIVQVKLPEDIDLNHYFEIMNTRGEQLELHEIAKSKLLEVLETDSERQIASLLWESCSDMDSYVQMNFKKSVREKIFTRNWTRLDNVILNGDFNSIIEKLSADEGLNKDEYIDKRSLVSILEKGMPERNDNSTVKKDSQDSDNRFESTINFPNFLLQVGAIMQKQEADVAKLESNLDDKKFLENLAWAWASPEAAKNYLYHMLKLRVLFDRYILKREYRGEFIHEGKWSLQKMRKEREDSAGYRNSLSANNKLTEVLQASLRITYTSPKTMHWITLLLRSLLEDEEVDIIEILENYSIEKIKDAKYKESEEMNGFMFDRIIFTHLDYLLYRDGYTNNNGDEIIPPRDQSYKVQFRSSIEHLYPQNPETGQKWEAEYLHSFGNLALLTVSDNSGFSNWPPESKIHKNKEVNNTSLKFKIMSELTNQPDGWTKVKAIEHRDEMFSILQSNARK